MPPEKRDPAFLFDILDAAQFIMASIRGKSFADYAEDRALRSVVERQLEIIGQASRHVSQTFKESHPEIPWRKIINQRHVLAHDYGEIKHESIWTVATINVPELIHLVTPLVLTPPPK